MVAGGVGGAAGGLFLGPQALKINPINSIEKKAVRIMRLKYGLFYPAQKHNAQTTTKGQHHVQEQ